MCIVTYIPTAGGFYLTSNRDERPGRAPALFPFQSDSNGEQLLYPKDGEAGGSWITLKSSGDAAVLLNGAFIRHHRKPAYRQSRGLVFLDITRAADPISAFEGMPLEEIEPFTLVLLSRASLFECRWDGRNRYVVRLSHDSPHIWSSATLYDEETASARRRLFGEWYGANTRIDARRILDFHRSNRLDNEKSPLAVDPQGSITTVSITSIRITAAQTSMSYMDLQTGQRQESGFGKTKNTPASSDPGSATTTTRPPSLFPRAFASPRRLVSQLRRTPSSLQRFFIRLTAWEYWPFSILYLPVFFYWAWLSAKARSFFFFSTANPSILNAGFLMESKQQIYSLMPEGSYPTTVYCPKGQPVVQIRQSMTKKGLKFPLIAKPDIGQRGMQVSLLRDECALYLYRAKTKVDFLLQEYIDYPCEAGIFYYRRPGEVKGQISGIVGKEMLAVVGDGVSTIESLLQKNDRYLLQLPVLRAAYGNFLRQIPATGEEQLLVPYGNHSRGAKFLDWTHKSTPELEETIDHLCRQIPGFYFGRLDIKFDTWEALCQGRNFSVIELNGAGSEPTHIYDPRHSVFFAWKEIIRHLRLLFDISRANAVREQLTPMNTAEGWKMLRDYARHEKLIS